MGQALGCIQVEESKVAIMEKCGKFNDVLRPEYHFVPGCLGYNLVGRLTLGLQLLDVRCETKRKDNAFVTVFASVQYRCPSNPSKMEGEKVRNAFYNLSNTKAQIRACVFDVIRERVPKLNLDDAFEQMKEIARAVGNKLKQDMSEYGYEITLTTDIEPDVHVKTAMTDKYAAAIKNEETIEKANTEKLQQIIRAEGDAESKRRLGSGIADQRKAIVDGLRDSMEDFTKHVCGTTGKDVMNMELVTQYFDTMKEIGTSSKASHVFLLHGPDAVKDISAQIRDEILPGKQVEERRLSIH